ncbi:hypothetical protein [Nocardia abscessus]|nr:hypothetical protein [Nocardia abscessus]
MAGADTGHDPAHQLDEIAEQYDQMPEYATAIRTGTAPTEAILRF